jgi:hypothetical protein
MPEIQSSPRPYRAKLSVDPASGERWALVEGPDGIAHYGTTLYGVDCLRGRGLSHNTQIFALGAVAIALNWAARRGVDLEARIASCEFLSRGEAFDLKQALRRNGNRDKVKDKKTVGLVPAVVAPATWVTRVRDVCAYLVWHAEDVVRRIPNRDDIRARDAGARIDDLKRILLDDLPAAKSGVHARSGRGGLSRRRQGSRRDGQPINPHRLSRISDLPSR